MTDDKKTNLPVPSPADPAALLLYQSDDGQTRIEVRLVGETLWLTQNQMAELFQTTKQNISQHLQSIYSSGELQSGGTVKRFLTVQHEGIRQVSRELEHYNLDAIISVGYRVNSLRGTQFRIWATQRLREYLVKGFVLDDDRLKAAGGGNYFEELLQRIRDTLASEKVFWRKILVRKLWVVFVVAVSLAPLANCSKNADANAAPPPASQPATARSPRSQPASAALAFVSAARDQVGKTLSYDPAYATMKYPGGDVPIEKGVCTDVVIRALRASLQMDLQKLVHEDMTAAFAQYPRQWGLRSPDSNIDHRRVPNLMRYFERQRYSLSVARKKEDYLPGDLVTCTVAGRLPHIMVVSDRKDADGVPLVIHNIGRGAQEEPRLFEFPLTGHYRIKMTQ